MRDLVPDGEEVYVHPERTEPMLLEDHPALAMVLEEAEAGVTVLDEVAAGEEVLDEDGEEVLAGGGDGQDGTFPSMRRHFWKMRPPSWREK